MIALRAMAFQAMPWLPRRAVLAIDSAERTIRGYATDHSSACMPPNDPPAMASSDSMPSASSRRFSARTMSPTVITGKFSAYGLPDALGIESRSEEHTSELQSHLNLVCRLLLGKKNNS